MSMTEPLTAGEVHRKEVAVAEADIRPEDKDRLVA